MPAESRTRALDGLRGLAVAAVVAFHLSRLDGGWLGVDAFFTLSGFLITSLLLAEIDTHGRLSVRRFWRRRIRRLQPASLVCITAVVATAWWWAPAGTGLALRGDALSALASVANWHLLWSHQPYAAGGQPSALEHFWSLAIEEQFYLVWPLALVAIVACARRHARVVTAVVAACGIAISWGLLARYDLQRGYLGTDTRLGSILLGALLACVLPLGTSRRIPGARTIGAVGLAGMTALWFAAGWPPHWPLIAVLPLHAVLATAAIIGATHGRWRALEWRPLVTLGLVSYAVYLWHWPVIVAVTPQRLGQNELVTDLVRLALTGALTAISWFVIEHPIRREHVLRATRYAFPAGAVVAVTVVTMTAGAVAPAPVWARATTGQIVHARIQVAKVLRPAYAPRRVLVVGDSVPTSLLATTDATGISLQVGEGHLLEQFSTAGINAISLTLTSCPVADEVIVADASPRRWCPQRLDQMLPMAVRAFKPDLVVWYSTAEAYQVQMPDGSRVDPISSPAQTLALRQRIAARVRWFAKHGARVVFVSPGPDRDGNDQVDLRRNSKLSMRYLDEQYRAVANADPRDVVGVIDMSMLTCPQWRTTGQCPDRMFGGGFFRPSDGEHFEHNGAVVAGAWLVQQVAALRLRRF